MVYARSRVTERPGNSALVIFAQVLNPLPRFKMWYDEIMQLVYVLVHRCGFTADDILHNFAVYDVFKLFEYYEKEVEEQEKQAKAEKDEQERMMANMQRQQQQQPQMPDLSQYQQNIPKF